MNHSDDKWENLLKQALAPAEEPDERLNQNIIAQIETRGWEDKKPMKPVQRKRLSIGIMAAAVALVMSITAVAATHYFSSEQVAEQLGERILAEAFASDYAVEINQTMLSGDYSFTLHGVVSGEGLREFNDATQEIYPDRTYAVVSIARQDGEPLPDPNDPEYADLSFFVSPLIKGEEPWKVNIVTLQGGYSEKVIDGVMYRLIECENVEIFADRGVYLAINDDTFFVREAFIYDEQTGEIHANNDYEGASVIFELPLDPNKADPIQAEAILQELHHEFSAGPETEQNDEEQAIIQQMEEIKQRIAEGKVILDSIKEVTYDAEGRMNYEYQGWSAKLSPEMMFTEGQIGFSDSIQYSVDVQGREQVLQFHRDEHGVITGRIIDLN